jgi:hypothetical protein
LKDRGSDKVAESVLQALAVVDILHLRLKRKALIYSAAAEPVVAVQQLAEVVVA